MKKKIWNGPVTFQGNCSLTFLHSQSKIYSIKLKSMKSLRVVLMSAIVMMAGLLAQAQTAEEIVAKHVAAIGGKEKLNTIKTVYTEYDMEVQGQVGQGLLYLSTGKGFRNEVDFGGQKLVQVYTDKGGWQINPFIGQTSAEPIPEEQLKGSKGNLLPGGPLSDYTSLGAKVELAGTEDVSGVKAHKLKLTMPDGPVLTMLIDPTTFYILKQIETRQMQGQTLDVTSTFSNYKKDEAGFVTPGTTLVEYPQFSFTLTPKKTEYNKEIDPKIYEMQ